MVASRFQAASLVGAPSCPNAIAWSDENLIAVASGHIVTILNPASPIEPRGTIAVPTGKHYPIGRVEKEDLLSGDLLPTALSRDRKPCARSIAWSSLGMSPNYGCLLAVCTFEGCVRVYRPPFCDYSTNWIEAADISDMLYDHLANVNFVEIDISTSEIPSNGVSKGKSAEDDMPNSPTGKIFKPVVLKQYKRRRVTVVTEINSHADSLEHFSEPRHAEITSTRPTHLSILDSKRSPKTKLAKLGKNKMGSCTFPLLTSKEYAARSALLSSLVVTWSPLLCSPSNRNFPSSDDPLNKYSILAVGGKSGNISFWRISAPQCYSIEHSKAPTGVMFLGLLQAHTSWVTAVSLELLVSNSDPQVVMVTGSTDGSVKLWVGNVEELSRLSKASKVVHENIVPISVLSVVLPSQPVDKMLIAVGKGSGSFEIWTCDTSNFKLDKAGCHDAHDYAVTGLCWSSDGLFLYSCGQDNYLRSWILRGECLSEVPIPSNIPGQTGLHEVPDALLSCLGVVASPGNLMVAMVRDLDVELLGQMYEARAQKAVVEFFWIGGQPVESTLANSSINFYKEAFPGFTPNELADWESNILLSLKQYEDPYKPLVVWDIITALLVFKDSIPKYVDYLLGRWLSTAFLDGQHSDYLPLSEVLTLSSKSFSEVPSRLLHLLNIMSRRIILSEMKAEELNSNVTTDTTSVRHETLELGLQTLLESERELRERLVGLSFAAFSGGSHSAATSSSQLESWSPLGVMQMEQWVVSNHAHVRNQLKSNASFAQPQFLSSLRSMQLAKVQRASREIWRNMKCIDVQCQCSWRSQCEGQLLLEVCPSYLSTSGIYYYRPENQQPTPSNVFLLKLWCSCDREGLLHVKKSSSSLLILIKVRVYSRLRMELLNPLRVAVVSTGPDTELLVANPVELSRRGRPLVFHDITLALKMLNACAFSVKIGR
ncbi:unnamed protein product [Linum tenue]|uniref:Transcription factor IIIC 90kDa subunit N-terminal domain-containing protein n=1 Tax=Linum tenue TaxID=586396 RepID=A0AAV0M8N2_9ROSI|nr:unnamed protein product [Linum tenue]